MMIHADGLLRSVDPCLAAKAGEVDKDSGLQVHYILVLPEQMQALEDRIVERLTKVILNGGSGAR